jgi:glycosyltransferase involved in cell wall biosynthesis
VVSFRSGGPEEIIEPDVSGILIEHSSAQLADTLERLLLDPELRLQIGTRARARIGEGFAAEEAVRHIEAALEDLSRLG